jgi:hypothetical protein
MNEKAQEIIDYIVREVIRRPDKQIIITEDTPLVSGGLIDSFRARSYPSEGRGCCSYADSCRKGPGQRYGHCEADARNRGTSRQTHVSDGSEIICLLSFPATPTFVNG